MPSHLPIVSSVRGARRQAGFTLIEIVVAFSILAVGLGIAMQIATGAMRQSRSAADYTEAALYAQSLLDAILDEGPARPPLAMSARGGAS